MAGRVQRAELFQPGLRCDRDPGLAIIDPAGKVRFNALRPYKGNHPSAKEEADHIDELLKEAKLPYPEQPFVEAEKEEPKKDEPKKG